MALTNQPYLPLYVQDWLSNNKLKICSPGAHGLMINIMCLMHKSDEYGTILLQQKFKQNEQQIINFATMVARLLPFEFAETLAYLTELLDEEILKIEDEKLICERMKKDAELSLKRSLVGSKGGKTTSKNNKNFATAKVQANSENEYVNEIKNEIVNNNKRQKNEKLEFPYYGEEFKNAWYLLLKNKKWKTKNNNSLQLSLNKLKNFDEEFSIKLIYEAIEKDWSGLVYENTESKFNDFINAKNGIIKNSNYKIGPAEHAYRTNLEAQQIIEDFYKNNQDEQYPTY